MNRNLIARLRDGLEMAIKGPWDSSSSSGDNDAAGTPAPTESQKPAGPRNPWEPSQGSEPSGNRKRTASIEDLFRRSGGGGNGGGWNGFPRRPDGKSFIPAIGAIILALWLLLSSVHQLGSQEKGVVTFFGKYSRTVNSGISFTWPAPVENLQKVDTQKIRRTLVGSPKADSNNLILTRDRNLIDMAYQISWSIKDPKLYTFQFENPDDTVKEVAESAMRAVISNFDFSQANGPGRGAIVDEVARRMQIILDRYQLGVAIRGVDILQSDPPAEVSEASDELNAAQQKSEDYQSKARAYRSEVTKKAEADAQEFNAIYEQYKLAPEVTKRRMYYDTMEQVLSQVDKTVVESGNVTPYLALPELQKRDEPKPAEVVVSGKKK
jgi:modulator of FtsH protease HflK